VIAFLVTGISRARWLHRLGTSFESITWNALNQLTAVTKNAVTQATYNYDPLGRRVEKVVGTTTTTWTYDAEDILRQNATAGGSSTATLVVHGPGIDESLSYETGGSGAWSYQHLDALGSVTHVTGSTGLVSGTTGYDPWGNIVSGSAGLYSFAGREWDETSKLYFNRARYYDPAAARFTSEDPIGFVGGHNFFQYVMGNPVNFTDPGGLEVYPNGVPIVVRPLNFATPMTCAESVVYGMELARQIFMNSFSRYRNSDKIAHCLAHCEISKGCGDTGKKVVEKAGHAKETLDDLIGRTYRALGFNPATSRPARQVADPEDFRSNSWGETCPVKMDCMQRCGEAKDRFK